MTLLDDTKCRRAVCPANEGIETGPLASDLHPPRALSRAVCPANEGIETRYQQSPLDRSLPRRAVCPANEGIETLTLLVCSDFPGLSAARSAPLMRGLKRNKSALAIILKPFPAARSAPLMRGLKQNKPGDNLGRLALGRAVCPANEGIETGATPQDAHTPFYLCRAVCPANEGIETCAYRGNSQFRYTCCRAVCPANEGIETRVPSRSMLAFGYAARSAPLMRGLKRAAFCILATRLVFFAARSAPLMRGLKR